MRENLDYPYGSGNLKTFGQLIANSTKKRFYCCTAIGSEKGRNHLVQLCPNLTLATEHNLGDRYNVRSPDFLVPHGMSDFVQKIEEMSIRAGINRASTWGHGELGLTIAFDHGIPDSTIPLISLETLSWTPLLKVH